jgi:hypothetical protein
MVRGLHIWADGLYSTQCLEVSVTQIITRFPDPALHTGNVSGIFVPCTQIAGETDFTAAEFHRTSMFSG